MARLDALAWQQLAPIRFQPSWLIELVGILVWAISLVFLIYRLHHGLLGIDDAHIFFIYAS
jgi:hypothetical protein